MNSQTEETLYMLHSGSGQRRGPSRGMGWVCAPLIPKNNALISLNPWKKISQLPESIFPLFPKSWKIISAAPQKYKPILPKMYFSFYRIKLTYLKIVKLYTSGWLNIHLIFYDMHVKIRFSHGIHDIYYCHKVKHISYTIPIFEVIKNNLSSGFIRHVHMYFGYQIWISSISFINYCPWTGSLLHSTVLELICKNELLLLFSHEIALKRILWINLQRTKRTKCVKLPLRTLVWS